MHEKKFILHINAYFKDESIFEEFGTIKHILYKIVFLFLFHHRN